MPTLKEQLKNHLDNKEYAQAIDLIQRSKLPADEKQKRVTLLLERMKAEARAEVEAKSPPEPVKVKGKPLPGTEGAPVKPASNSTRNLLVGTIVVVGGLLLAFGVWFVQNQRNSGMYAKVYGVCSDVFTDDYYAEMFTAHQFVAGCLVVTDETMERYRQEVTYCFDNEAQTDARFMACLADNDVKMYSTAILNTPKE